MRVNKAILNYIEQEVEKRLMPKYEPMHLEADRQRKAIEALNKGIKAAGIAAARAYAKEHGDTVKDFAEPSPSYSSDAMPAFSLQRQFWSGSIHQWEKQMQREKDAKTNEIAAILELGGNKEDLEQFLLKLESETAASSAPALKPV